MATLADNLKGAAKSKTMWAGLLTLVGANFIPVVESWITAHPGPTATLLGVVMMVLRSLTNDSLADKAAPTEAGK
jgi:hypothetical protein